MKREPDPDAVDYASRVIVPVRDMEDKRCPIIFDVVVYGVKVEDLCVIPDGQEPIVKAVARLGLDPSRYTAMLIDLMSMAGEEDHEAQGD